MHPHAALLEKLYTCLDRKDHEGMASCYHSEATFEDIAFKLRGIKQIHAMWHMIAETDLRATFTVKQVDGQTGTVDLVDVYTFSETGRQGPQRHCIQIPVPGWADFGTPRLVQRTEMGPSGTGLGEGIGFLDRARLTRKEGSGEISSVHRQASRVRLNPRHSRLDRPAEFARRSKV